MTKTTGSIKKRIEWLKKNAMRDHKFEKLERMRKELFDAFLCEEISTEDYEAAVQKLIARFTVLELFCLDDFQRALKMLGIGDNDAEEIIQHEFSHFAKTVELGFKAVYRITFFCRISREYCASLNCFRQKRKLVIQPSVRISFKAPYISKASHDLKNALCQIYDAPLDKSPDDMRYVALLS